MFMHSSFSLFLMSGLAALMSILRLDVGVQGSTERTSIPFFGVVRGPMVIQLSTNATRGLDNFLGYLLGPKVQQSHHPGQKKKTKDWNLIVNCNYNIIS